MNDFTTGPGEKARATDRPVRKAVARSMVAIGLCLVLLLALAGAAIAAWGDVSNTLLDTYGISERALEGISDRYEDGTWRPAQPLL